MSRSVNKVILLGNLGQDAETRYTPDGTPVSRLSVATNRRVKDSASGEWRDETEWHSVILWRSESLVKHLTKGKQIYIEGRLQTRKWDKDGEARYSTSVVADELILLGGDGAHQAQAQRPSSEAFGGYAPTDDDFPENMKSGSYQTREVVDS